MKCSAAEQSDSFHPFSAILKLCYPKVLEGKHEAESHSASSSKTSI